MDVDQGALNFSSVTDYRRDLLAKVLWTIHYEGPFVDEDGKALNLLVAALGKRGVRFSSSYVTAILKEFEGFQFGRPLVRRDMPVEKRTMRIELLVPVTHPGFPSDPFEGRAFPPPPPPPPAAAAVPSAPAPEPSDDDEVVKDLDGVVVTTTLPGMELEPVDEEEVRKEESALDLMLFAISLLTDAVQRISSEQAGDVARVLNEHVPNLLFEIRVANERADRAERHAEGLSRELVELRRTRMALDRTKIFDAVNRGPAN